ncbi:hypothetical protein [Neogemmobacter tilapiae]|uniref:hypothetical protein n=1 Tax=Neogemmobacter tilapiae TaxID=875041 RepID=UPI00167B0793|nr:hypothetical protein [Gemmobacter tilapiae]
MKIIYKTLEKKMKVKLALMSLLAIASIATSLQASDCGSSLLSGRLDLTPPNSVPNTALQDFINDGPSWAENVKVSVEEKGADLWIDITEFPGTSSAAVAPRIAFLIGRVSSGNHSNIVFADDSRGIFVIDEVVLKNIGCRFVIEQEGGENPIVLMREFYNALLNYDGRERVAPIYNGNLLGDTNIALSVNNDVFVPGWVLSAVK